MNNGAKPTTDVESRALVFLDSVDKTSETDEANQHLDSTSSVYKKYYRITKNNAP